MSPNPAITAEDVRRIRADACMSRSVFAALLNVGTGTVAQWEQGKKTPSGSSARLLDILSRKGVEALV